MHNQLSKKGRIALTLYFLLLLCIVVFGIYYDMSVKVILLFSLVYSLAAIGAYFGKTAKQKIALTNSAQNYRSYTIRVGGAKCSKKLYKEVNYYGESEGCNAA